MKKITLVLILIISLLLINTDAKKIQKLDEWTYKDNLSNNYAEKAINIIQLVDYGQVIASVKTETNRPYPMLLGLDLPLLNNFSSSKIKMVNYGMYLTQEGSIPYIPYNYSISGEIIHNNTIFPLDNATYEFAYQGNPSIAFTTTSSTEYAIHFYARTLDMVYSKSDYYIISSDNDVNDKIKNFTITMKNTVITLDYNNTAFYYDSDDIGKIDLLAIDNIAMKFTYDENITQPIMITQTLPVQTSSNNIKLSSLTDKVVYTLIQSIMIIDNATTEGKIFYPLTLALLPIIIISLRKR